MAKMMEVTAITAITITTITISMNNNKVFENKEFGKARNAIATHVDEEDKRMP